MPKDAGPSPSRLVVVRHASAGARASWNGPDRLRPLDRKGTRQADGLARALATKASRPAVRLEPVLSSPYLRCVQTVEPLARRLGLTVEEEDSLAEGQGAAAVRLARRLVDGTPASERHAPVLCTHGDIIPLLLAEAASDGVDIGADPRWAKGSAWILEGDAGVFTAAHYRPPTIST